MLSRRGFLCGISAITSIFDRGVVSFAEEAGGPQSQVAVPDVSNAEKMLYAAVRLADNNKRAPSFGTGFLFELFEGPQYSMSVIVTNRHVVEPMLECSFTVHRRRSDGQPDTDGSLTVNISNFRQRWVPHTTDDLVIIPISNEINDLVHNGTPPYWTAFQNKDVPSLDTLNSLNPIEEVLTVGYPGFFFDQSHNNPIFHAGHTATAPFLTFSSSSWNEDHTIEYRNDKTFLIDFTPWYGASGSPVFVYNTNGFIDRKGVPHFLQQRLLLLGIVQGLAVQNVDGTFELELPKLASGKESVTVPTNLGICILSSAILDFEDILLDKGFRPTWEYTKAIK
jgi:hypothetical protein